MPLWDLSQSGPTDPFGLCLLAAILMGKRAMIEFKGSWKHLCRAVDKAGAMVDFLLTAKGDHNAAPRFLRKAIKRTGTPEKITIDRNRRESRP